MGNEYVLELQQIEKSFSDVRVLQGVDLRLKKGKILGLCGENGAGKSTLMNVLSGVYRLNGGIMLLDGQPYEPKSPLDARDAGIAFVHQELNLFLNLTVKQNFMIDHLPRRGPFINNRKIIKKAEEVLSRIDDTLHLNTVAGDLSIGRRQMLEIAKEVAKDARIIIFDEPTSSLSRTESEQLLKLIRSLADQGVSVIYISHILDDVFRLCDEIMVLRDGRSIGQDETASLTKEEVIHRMVGRKLENLYPYAKKHPAGTGLEICGISWGGAVKQVSLSVRKGEIVGMFGLMGAGRSELMKVVYGIEKQDAGYIVVNGKKLERIRPYDVKKMGMAYITENRREEGLLMNKSLKENITLANMEQMTGKGGLISRKKELDCTNEQIRKLAIKSFDPEYQTASQFSGGNQQKIIFAKWLVTKPNIFLLDEPTRGVDVGAKQEIYGFINELALNGTAVLFVSSEMEELMGVCDRIVVMSKGSIAGELKREEYDPDRLLAMAIAGGGSDE